jgi:hypothetical protein
MKSKFIVNEPYVIALYHDHKLGKRFKGIAKCQPTDKFDEEKGKKIAQARMEINRLSYKGNKVTSNMKFLTNYCNKKLDALEARLDLYGSQIEEKAVKLNEFLSSL